MLPFEFRVTVPEAQMMQSPEPGPEQVWQSGEHGVQEVPLLKLLSGQTTPAEVVDWIGMHFVRSLGSWVNPLLQEIHWPVVSAHCVHPSWHTMGKVSLLRRWHRSGRRTFAITIRVEGEPRCTLRARSPIARVRPPRITRALAITSTHPIQTITRLVRRSGYQTQPAP